ncbi:MAG: homoaconitate hydratase [Clostridia bacterium]|nr:homoaconitate hydratase [Clostridia bacterium]
MTGGWGPEWTSPFGVWNEPTRPPGLAARRGPGEVGVVINDCTLREGEQAAGVDLPLSAKLRVARLLAEAGVRQVEVGYPGRSRIDFEFAQALRAEGLGLASEALVQIFFDDWREQIDRAVEAGVDWIVLMHPASDLRLRHVHRVSREEVVARAARAIDYARSRGGARVRFSPTDTTRADPAFLRDLYGAAVAAGAERVTVADTAGASTPEAFAELVRRAGEWSGVPVHIHAHNDFGLALANTLAGIAAGAASADATLGGLGERTGNCALEQLAAALELLYGVPTGIRLARLTGLVRAFFEECGARLPDSQPLVGRDAFAHKLDAHVLGVARNPAVYESVAAEAVGNARRVPLGKYAGPAAIAFRLRALGLLPEGADDGFFARVAERVEDLAVRARREVTDDEIARIAAEAAEGRDRA